MLLYFFFFSQSTRLYFYIFNFIFRRLVERTNCSPGSRNNEDYSLSVNSKIFHVDVKDTQGYALQQQEPITRFIGLFAYMLQGYCRSKVTTMRSFLLFPFKKKTFFFISFAAHQIEKKKKNEKTAGKNSFSFSTSERVQFLHGKFV